MIIFIGLVFIAPMNFGRLVHTPQQGLISHFRFLESQLALYHNDYGIYPKSLSELINDGKYGPYLLQEPKDPWGNLVGYTTNSARQEFTLYSLGADGKEGGENENADIFYNHQ